MDNEYYNIEVVFEVVESSNNMNNGNIYLTSKITSYNPASNVVTFYRMGAINYKGSFEMYFNDFFKFIPFCSYFFNC